VKGGRLEGGCVIRSAVDRQDPLRKKLVPEGKAKTSPISWLVKASLLLKTGHDRRIVPQRGDRPRESQDSAGKTRGSVPDATQWEWEKLKSKKDSGSEAGALIR